MSPKWTRREFLESGTAGVVGLSAFGAIQGSWAVGASSSSPPPVRVRVIFLAKPKPTWPTPYLDVQNECSRVDAELRQVARQVPDVELVGGDLLRVGEHLNQLKGTMGDIDGVLVFNLTSTVGHLVRGITEYGVPTILFSQPFSGHDWCEVADMQREGNRIDVMATSDFGELARGLRAFRTVRRLRDARILCITGGKLDEGFAKAVKGRFGTTITLVEPDRLVAMHNAADESESGKMAREVIEGAEKVVEPSTEEIRKSCRLYYAMRNMLEQENAQAIAINCLGLFGQGRLPAYPCIGFSRLNDEGLVGACEADLQSTLTMLTFGYLVERPGFISDPVIDTSKNAVIHAHCVSATKMDGIDGETCPYVIRSHMEDDKGAALQVEMRIGQKITMARYLGTDTMLVSTGEITDTPVLDRGCRTKITTRVADARKVLRQYTGGLHRVIFYGDHVEDIYRLSRFLGFNVVEEC